MEYKICRADELYHWGIKGMRWGIRRYQNKDGTLTEAGKKRLAKEQAALDREEQIMKNRKATQTQIDQLAARRKAIDEDKKKLNGEDTEKPRKKKISEMTNDELKDMAYRAEQLHKYYDNTKKINTIKADQTSTGKKFFIAAMQKIVDPAITNAGKGALEKSLKEAWGVDKNNSNGQQNQSGGKKNKNKNKNKTAADYSWEDAAKEIKAIVSEERSDIKEIANFFKDFDNIITDNRREY